MTCGGQGVGFNKNGVNPVLHTMLSGVAVISMEYENIHQEVLQNGAFNL